LITGTELLDTENQYGDDFVILASHVLIDLYIKKGGLLHNLK